MSRCNVIADPVGARQTMSRTVTLCEEAR